MLSDRRCDQGPDLERAMQSKCLPLISFALRHRLTAGLRLLSDLYADLARRLSRPLSSLRFSEALSIS